MLDVRLDGGRHCVAGLVACVGAGSANDGGNEGAIALILHTALTVWLLNDDPLSAQLVL